MPESGSCDIVRRNNEPPEVVLQDLAMAGLVGILRQLGDLEELAADVFQDLHDKVMDASARGRRLAARAKQLEADQDLLVYAAAAASNTKRLSWHADPKVSHGVVAGGDMPSFIAEYIRQCRGPPGLFILDKYDADGDGACLRRYTDPSFLRRTNSAKLQQDTLRRQAYLRGKEKGTTFQSSEECNPPKSAHTDSRSETDTSENASPRFLSTLRQLKHRQTSGSVFPISLKPQRQQNIQKHQSPTPTVEKASSVEISFTSSPDLCIPVCTSTTSEKARENQQANMQYQNSVMSDYWDAGSDYREQSNELKRSSSFEAWLSSDFRTPELDVTEESYHDTSSNGISSHGITSRDVARCGTMNAKQQDSVTAEMSSNACGSNKSSKYKGSLELIASRVTSFPRKLFKKHNDPSIDYVLNNIAKKQLEPTQDTGTGSSPGCGSEYSSITSCNPAESSQHVLEADPDPVFVIQDSLLETSDQCYPRHENTMRKINGSPRKCASVQTENSGSEDADLVMPPLPPIRPMQWLSVKVHTGPIAHRNSVRKDPRKPREGKILLKTSEFADPTVHPDEPWSEPACSDPQPGAETRLHQEPRRQNLSGGTDRPTEKLIEDHGNLDCKWTDNSTARGKTVPTSEASKHSNAATQVDLQNESVFISAVQELAKRSPPSVPTPKSSLLEVGSHDIIAKLRNGPGLIHPSRNLLDRRSAVLEEIRDKPFSVKPDHGSSSSNVMASPTNSIDQG